MAFLFALVLLLILNQRSLANPRNFTIDDADPRTVFEPPDVLAWHTLRDFDNKFKYMNVDTSQIYGNSLSTLASLPLRVWNLSLTFDGTNIWAYFATDAASGTEVLFYLDDEPKPAGSFREAANSSQRPWTWSYNQVLFASKTLTQGTHTLTMYYPGNNSWPWFDYAVYSSDDGEPELAHLLPKDYPSPYLRTYLPTGTEETESGPSAIQVTPLEPHAHAPLKPSVIAVPVLCGAAIVAVFCSWTMVRRRRRRGRDHTTAWHEPEGTDDPATDALTETKTTITPYAARPRIREKTGSAMLKHDLMEAVLGLKQNDDVGGLIVSSRLPGVDSAAAQNNDQPLVEGERVVSALDPVRARNADQGLGESTAEIRAELERVRAEAEQARAENEMLRLAAEPPPYSDGGSSERGSISSSRGRL